MSEPHRQRSWSPVGMGIRDDIFLVETSLDTKERLMAGITTANSGGHDLARDAAM